MEFLKKRSIPTRILHALILATILGCAGHFIQTPYTLRAPGRASEVAPMVKMVVGQNHPARGSFLLTTVIYDRASVLYCLYAALDPFAELLPAEQGPRERADSSDRQMAASQYLAKAAALRLAGHRLKARPSGARILRVLPDSPAQGRLEAGDIIVSAGGEAIATAEELIQIIQDGQTPDRVRLAIVRDGERAETAVETYRAEGRRLLGVQIRTELNSPDLPLDIHIEPGRISGASAGLMFSLEIYNRLTQSDFTGGYRIAGTGTIGPQGQVGPVSGADLKVVAAYRAGAQCFLCPRENGEEVRATGIPVTILEVDSLQEAVDKLGQIQPKG